VTVGEFSMNVANSLVIYYTHVDLLKTEPIAVGRIFLAHALEGPLRGNVKRAGAPIQVEHNAVWKWRQIPHSRRFGSWQRIESQVLWK
jgi:hypothetical protein